MSLLKQDTTKKGQIDKNNAIKLNTSKNSKNYKVKAIYNSTIYTRELKLDYLPTLYYLIFSKNYQKKKIPKSLY